MKRIKLINNDNNTREENYTFRRGLIYRPEKGLHFATQVSTRGNCPLSLEKSSSVAGTLSPMTRIKQ